MPSRAWSPITLVCRELHQSPQVANFIALARELGSEYRKEPH